MQSEDPFPTGVYAFPDAYRADTYRRGLQDMRGESHDVWRIPAPNNRDVGRAPGWNEDPDVQGAEYTKQPVMNAELHSGPDELWPHEMENVEAWTPFHQIPDVTDQQARFDQGNRAFELSEKMNAQQAISQNPQWGIGKPNRVWGSIHEADEDEDYRMNHRPAQPGDEEESTGAPFHAVDQVMPDYYEHPNYYAYGSDPQAKKADQEAYRALLMARGNPEAPVKIYRATPANVINNGDWVTQSLEYAKMHAMHPTDPSQDMPIAQATVPAHTLWTSGDDHHEFGYWGDPQPQQQVESSWKFPDPYQPPTVACPHCGQPFYSNGHSGFSTMDGQRIGWWCPQCNTDMKQVVNRPLTASWKFSDDLTTFNPVAPIDELTNYLAQGGGSAAGMLNPNNPLSQNADPIANKANPNMNPNNPNAFANPANPELNAALPGAQTNPANPQFNPSVPGAQNNPSNPQFNPSMPGATNNSANPELNPAYPGSMTNPSSPMHNPDYPDPSAISRRPENLGPNASFPAQVEASQGSHGRRWAPVVSQTLYHVAPTTERDRIQQHGVQPANPKLNWPTFQENETPPVGAYGFNDLDRAKRYLITLEFRRGVPHDIWEMNSEEHAPDPDLGGSSQYATQPLQAQLLEGPEHRDDMPDYMRPQYVVPTDPWQRGNWPLGEDEGKGRAYPKNDPEAWSRMVGSVQRESSWKFANVSMPHMAADLPGFEIGDSLQHADPTEPRSSNPPAPPHCTCMYGLKLQCPVHGLDAPDPTDDDDWGKWHIPESNPVGYPSAPRGWSSPYQP
jgi:hypothetical protein